MKKLTVLIKHLTDFLNHFSIFGTAARQERYMYKSKLTRCSYGCLEHKQKKDFWSSWFQFGVDRGYTGIFQNYQFFIGHGSHGQKRVL